jgi:hypothetical protein
MEPAMLKGVFPTPYQPVTVTTAFFKSLPPAVLPVIAVTVIVFPIVAVTVIVFPIIAVIVFPIIAVIVFPIIAVIVFPIIAISAIVLPAVALSPILSKDPRTAGSDQERCGQRD